MSDGAGGATRHTREALGVGIARWRAAASNSAGAAAAARSSVFGLLWSRDPARAAYEAALSATVTHGHPAATAAAISLAANGKGPLGSQWLADLADICEQYPQGDIYGATVADRIRLLPALLGADLGDALDQTGGSALSTEAVPAALLAAATAPEPVTAAFGTAADWGVRHIAGLHPACRAMMGACIGARRGESAWTSWEAMRPPVGIPSDALVRARGTEAVLDMADRIAGKRVRPVERQPEPREGDEPDAPVHISFLIDRSGSMSGLQSDVVEGCSTFAAHGSSSETDVTISRIRLRPS